MAVVDLDGQAADAVASEINAHDHDALGITAAVSREDDTLRMATTARKYFGRIDVLVTGRLLSCRGRQSAVCGCHANLPLGLRDTSCVHMMIRARLTSATRGREWSGRAMAALCRDAPERRRRRPGGWTAGNVEAISWALHLAPIPRDSGGKRNPACKAVLVGLANRGARREGRVPQRPDAGPLHRPVGVHCRPGLPPVPHRRRRPGGLVLGWICHQVNAPRPPP
jgi:hypothetical protein